MSRDDLFRPEAVAHHRQRLYGVLHLRSPLTHWAVFAAIVLGCALCLGVLLFGSYARKEIIEGWVRPDLGVIEIVAPEAATVERVHVKAGDTVRAGEPLLSLRINTALAAGEPLAQRLARQQSEEGQALQSQAQASAAQFALRAQQYQAELQAAQAQQAQLARRLAVAEERVSHATEVAAERTALRQRGLLALQEQTAAQDRLLNARAEYEALAQAQLDLRSQQTQLKQQLARLPLERSAALGGFAEKLAQLNQRATATARQSSIVLTAPLPGRIANLRVLPGDNATAQLKLIELLPQGAHLQAELYAPSRSVGFLREGMPVRLSYDAFPHQKFGFGRGRVLSIASTSTARGELPRALGAEAPGYRVIIALEQAPPALDQPPLRLLTDMRLRAYVVLEERRVWELLLGPVLSLWRR